MEEVIYKAFANEPESRKGSSYGFFTPIGASSSKPVKQTEIKSGGFGTPADNSGMYAQLKSITLDSPTRGTDSEELIFDFESDEVNSVHSTDVEESDREEKEEGISIPRTTPARPNMAQSLPMNIPAFAKPRAGSTEDLEDLPVGENIDIAASMKALAKSVHGDPVFGDVPRPRFSTQI